MMLIYRGDTGDLVSTRPLEPNERQTAMFPIEGGKKSGKKSGGKKDQDDESN